MIKETYCSCEIARLFKKKGLVIAEHTSYVPKHNDDGTTELVTTITHQTARRWLRDIHNIDIDIESEVGMLGRKVYVPLISTYKPIENTDADRFRQVKRGLYYKDDKGLIPALQYFHSYEEAVEAALKYILENLI